jgi:hypothetical protein
MGSRNLRGTNPRAAAAGGATSSSGPQAPVPQVPQVPGGSHHQQLPQQLPQQVPGPHHQAYQHPQPRGHLQQTAQYQGQQIRR